MEKWTETLAEQAESPYLSPFLPLPLDVGAVSPLSWFSTLPGVGWPPINACCHNERQEIFIDHFLHARYYCYPLL